MNTPQVLILIARARALLNALPTWSRAHFELYEALTVFNDINIHLIPCIGGQVVPVTSSPDPYAGRNRPGRVGMLDL
jgi:hypothetical protein